MQPGGAETPGKELWQLRPLLLGGDQAPSYLLISFRFCFIEQFFREVNNQTIESFSSPAILSVNETKKLFPQKEGYEYFQMDCADNSRAFFEFRSLPKYDNNVFD